MFDAAKLEPLYDPDGSLAGYLRPDGIVTDRVGNPTGVLSGTEIRDLWGHKAADLDPMGYVTPCGSGDLWKQLGPGH